jgi:hypothetical protein
VSNIKAVCADRFPGFVGTKIPPTLDYPIQKSDKDTGNGERAWEICKGVVETGYQLSLTGRASGIWKILKNA